MSGAQVLLDLAAKEPDPARREALAQSAAAVLLRESILGCCGCGLRALGGRTPVPWSGGRSPVALVGEAPGADEEREGVPFVGRSGQLLNLLLREAGLDRSKVAAVNVVCCRPPDNDFGVADRMGAPWACRSNLKAQLDMTGAWLIVCLGMRALEGMVRLTGTAHKVASMTRMRGNPFFAGGFLIVPTFHPAYALRNPAAKGVIRADLALAGRLLGGEGMPVGADARIMAEFGPSLDMGAFRREGWGLVYSPVLGETMVVVKDERVSVPDAFAGPRWTLGELWRVRDLARRGIMGLPQLRAVAAAKAEFGGVMVV